MESRNEKLLRAMIDGTGKEGLESAQSRIEALLYELMDKIDQGGGGGGGSGLTVPAFTFRGGKWSCDMTFADVQSAVKARTCFFGTFDSGEGGIPVLVNECYEDEYVSFGTVNAIWGMTSIEGVQFFFYQYNSDGSITTGHNDYPST